MDRRLPTEISAAITVVVGFKHFAQVDCATSMFTTTVVEHRVAYRAYVRL